VRIRERIDFSRFFRRDEELAERARYATWTELIDWASQSYHAKFLDWLEGEASKSVRVSESHMEMVKAAVRANTLREVSDHIKKLTREAEAGLQAAREESDV
jgi:hypothetical protein